MHRSSHTNGEAFEPGQPYSTGRITPNITHDAVVIVPGILGSELYDTDAGRPLWGLKGGRWLVRAWARERGLEGLHLTPREQEGQYGRVKPMGLLKVPVWAPLLKGIEPYSQLVSTVRAHVPSDSAVLCFPYDWRLSVAVNGSLLAAAARKHLQQWRSQKAYQNARKQATDGREGRLVFVAHSMGGLVTHAALTMGYDNDLAADTRGVLTLGTPFKGAVMAASMLNGLSGTPIPLPRAKLKALAHTMPGVHDLLPRFPCVEDGTDVRPLTPQDVEALGGNRQFAQDSLDFFRRQGDFSLPAHRAVVGVDQDTVQSLTLESGLVTASEYCFRYHSDGELMRDENGIPHRWNVTGDGTVHEESATFTQSFTPLGLQHGSLAKAKPAMTAVKRFLLSGPHLGPEQAGENLGLTVPDCVEPGQIWEISISGSDNPADVDCVVESIEDSEGAFERSVSLRSVGGEQLVGHPSVPREGLFRVTVEAAGNPILTQLVLAASAANANDDR
ncbi:hypothetical protein OG613_46135 (plasmid) [Streptomyces sp. NBC_00015]|uniref:esterase/lipase family protein n=1 Tax=Streptomyces sp. NBC_00015 TaxID=2903611 RepID=UPI002F91BD28